MNNFQTCPCCNQDPRYKQTVIDLLDFVVKECKDIVADIQLQSAVSNSHLEEVDEMVSKGNLNGLIKLVDDDNFISTLESQKKVIESTGKMEAYSKIIQYISTKI